jgi:hypothetical protein
MLQLGAGIAHEVRACHKTEGENAGHRTSAEQGLTGLLPKQIGDGYPSHGSGRHLPLEHGRLIEAEPDIQSNGDKHCTEQERHPPSPSDERRTLLADGDVDREKYQIAHKEAESNAELGEHP